MRARQLGRPSRPLGQPAVAGAPAGDLWPLHARPIRRRRRPRRARRWRSSRSSLEYVCLKGSVLVLLMRVSFLVTLSPSSLHHLLFRDRAGHGSTFSDLGWVGSGDFLSGLGWVNPWVKSMGQTHGSKGKNYFLATTTTGKNSFALLVPKLLQKIYFFLKKT